MLGRQQRLWPILALWLIASRVLGARSAPLDPMTVCTQHLQAIGRALSAYQREHHALPPNLSDLYPRYVRDVKLLHCPADPTPGVPGYVGAKPDPNMPISYFYEMSLEKDPAGLLLGPQAVGDFKNWRDLKLAQRRYFGDRVPMVRCWHHFPQADPTTGYAGAPTVLNLTPSGQVYRSLPAWEWDPGLPPVVLANMERDLKAGARHFRGLWSPVGATHYVSSLPRVSPATGERLRAVADLLTASGKKDAAMAEVGMLTLVGAMYRAAGYTAKAVDALDRAARAPGEHRQAVGQLAEIYHQTGKDGQAIRLLEELLTKEADNVQYMELLARAYEDDDQPEKADAWRSKVNNWLVGEPAPDFSLTDTRGKLIRLSERRGKVVLLFFWNSADVDSAWQSAYLGELSNRYRTRGLLIFVLNNEPTHADAKGAARLSFSFPLLLDAGPVFRQYGVVRIPTTYVIDGAGRVALRRVGFDAETAQALNEAVDRLLPTQSASRTTDHRTFRSAALSPP